MPVSEESIPLVIVEGFLCGAGSLLWGDFEQSLNHTRRGSARGTIFPSIGPVSSLHDRACELYYALLGGTVDYGADHGKAHGHARYGRTIEEGLYPLWSRKHPLHFLGHSIGGPTITKLQYLFAQNHFGPNAHPDMIRSISTISAPFRGTHVVYTLGERPDAAPAVRPLSVGALIAKAVHLAAYLAPLLPRALDLHAEARALSFRDTSLRGLFRQLWHSDWAEGRDAAPFDVTFTAADERESGLEGRVSLNTYYRSYAACMTQRKSPYGVSHAPPLSSITSGPLYVTSLAMCSYDFSVLRPTPSFLADKAAVACVAVPDTFDTGLGDSFGIAACATLGEEYWANDGIVPLFSQWHPLQCRSTTCRHYDLVPLVSHTNSDKSPKPEAGIWHVYHMSQASHISFMPVWTGSPRQREFWDDLGQWLEMIDNQPLSGLHSSDETT